MIGGGEINGPALLRNTASRNARTAQVDEPAAISQVVRIQHRFRRSFHVGGIADIGVQIGECEFHRLELQMNAVGAIDWELSDRVCPQYAQRD